MIDTIILTIPQVEFKVTNKERFNNLTKNSNKLWYKITVNPNRNDLLFGNYRPRLTLYRRKYGLMTLKIEFSAPKMIYGNNFDEIKESDFNQLVSKLQKDLQYYGITIDPNNLIQAKVTSIHYSKNIKFEDGTTVSMILNELNKIDMTKRWDLERKDFRNEGHALTYHTNYFELTFYDKIQDMQQSKISGKRAIEKDNLIQLNLFDRLKENHSEVLRIELRLNNKRKIKNMLEKVGIDTDLNFHSLFKKEISQKLLKYYWENIESKIGFLKLKIDNPTDLLEEMITQNPDLLPSKALQLLGFVMVSQDSNQRRLKNILNYRRNNNTFYRLNKRLKNIKINKNRKYVAINSIKQAISDFKPVKLDND